LEGYAEVVQESLAQEQTMRQRYYNAPKEAASEYESLKAQYYSDTLAE